MLDLIIAVMIKNENSSFQNCSLTGSVFSNQGVGCDVYEARLLSD